MGLCASDWQCFLKLWRLFSHVKNKTFVKHRKIEGKTVLSAPLRENPGRYADARPVGVFTARFSLCDDRITDLSLLTRPGRTLPLLKGVCPSRKAEAAFLFKNVS